MSEYDHIFWTSDNKYQSLAQMFERNIKEAHPDSVTSRCHHCPGEPYYHSTEVSYLDYQGSSIP